MLLKKLAFLNEPLSKVLPNHFRIIIPFHRLTTSNPNFYFSSFSPKIKTSYPDPFDAYKLSFNRGDLKTSVEKLNSFFRSGSSENLGKVFVFLNEELKLNQNNELLQSKVFNTLMMILDYLKKSSGQTRHSPETKYQNNPKKAIFLPLEAFTAFLDLITIYPQKHLSKIVNNLVLSNLINLIELRMINSKNFIEIIKKVLSGKTDNIEHHLTDFKSKEMLGNFLKGYLDIEENCTPQNLQILTEFVSYMPVDSSTRNKIASLLHKKLSNSLSLVEHDKNVIKELVVLLPSFLSFIDVAQNSICEILQALSTKTKNIVFDLSAIKLIIETYKKTKTPNYSTVTPLLFSLYNKLLENQIDHTQFNMNKLKLDDVIIIGNIIIEHKLENEPLLNLMKGCLKPEYSSKIKINLERYNYIYNLQIESLDETLKIEKPVETSDNPQQFKELIKKFFFRLHPFFNFQGLLLILYINSTKFLTLGTHESLLFVSLRRESSTATDETTAEILKFLKNSMKHKKYLSWLSAFDPMWFRAFKDIQVLNASKLMDFVQLLTQGRSDLAYQEFRSLDVLLDNALSNNSERMKSKAIDLTLSHLVSSRMECHKFYDIVKQHFEQNYNSINLGPSISFLFRFVFLGLDINERILDTIVDKYQKIDFEKNDSIHFQIHLKLLSVIMLLGKTQNYQPQLYYKIISQILTSWGKTYSEAEKE